MKNILLPTDFSKNSISAIDYAVQFFKDTSCNFYILNVQKASTFISDDMMVVASSSTIYNTIIDAARKSIANIISIMENRYNNKNHKFLAMVDYDNFIDSINQTSKLHNIDLIVMGTKGASGLSKFIFGSNTVRVMQRTNVPVLAIPDGCKFSELNSVAFMADHDLKKQIEILKPLKELLTIYNTELTALLLNKDLKVVDTDNNFLETLFSKVNYENLEVSNSNLFDVVDVYLAKNNIQMLAMLSEKHSFLERLFHTHKVETFGFKIHIPFFVMHT